MQQYEEVQFKIRWHKGGLIREKFKDIIKYFRKKNKTMISVIGLKA